MGHVHARVYVFIDHWHCSCDYHTIFMWLSCDFQHWKYTMYSRWFYLMYCKIVRLMCTFPDFCRVPLITMYIHVHIIIGCDFIWILLVDGLYAVYEASTLELWSFMMVSAFGARNFIVVAVYYTLLILFIVIILQVINVPVNCASLTIFSLFLPIPAKYFSCRHNRIICWFEEYSIKSDIY